MDVFIYQGVLYCDDCGRGIRYILADSDKVPADPDDERTYDSDNYPKGPFPDGGGEADGVEYCAGEDDCSNSKRLTNGSRVPAWLENPLTAEGVEAVRAAIGESAVEVFAVTRDCADLVLSSDVMIRQAIVAPLVRRAQAAMHMAAVTATWAEWYADDLEE